jgi:uncharacterized protein YbdZ (MbtH family)
MVKDEASLQDIAPGSAPPLLFTFNEPDVPTSTAYMPVQKMISLWPKIESIKAKKIVAPAFSKKFFFQLMDAFLRGNGTYVPTVDYVNIHWLDLDVFSFLFFVDQVWATYQKPIYISEFSMADWEAAKFGRPSVYTSKDVEHFLHVAIPGLEHRAFVVGYSYYSSVSLQAFEFSSLWNADQTVRPAGWVYGGYPADHNGTSSKI